MKGLAGLTLEIVPKGNSDTDWERGWMWGLSRQNTPGPQNQRGKRQTGKGEREEEMPGQQDDAPELHS